MIRINLLPITDEDRAEEGQKVFLVLFLLVAICSGAGYYVSTQSGDELSILQSRLNRLKRKQQALDQQIASAKMLETTFTELKASADRQQEVIDDLTQNQSTPAGMMWTLSKILSPPRDDNERQNFIQRDWRLNWRSGGVWLDEFRERDREIQLIGFARSNADVSEFLKRLDSSPHFYNVVWSYSQNFNVPLGGGRKGRFVRFQVLAKGLFGPSDLKRLVQSLSSPSGGQGAAQ